MIRPAAASHSTTDAPIAALDPQVRKLALALVSARPAALVIADAEIELVDPSRGISPLLAPGFDAVLVDLADAEPARFDLLRRIVNLGPDLPVIALIDGGLFTPDLALQAIDAGAEDACLFDDRNPAAVKWTIDMARARFERRRDSTTDQKAPTPADTPAEPMTVVQETSDAMIILDAEGRVAFANSAAADLIGRPLETLAGARLELPTETDKSDIRFTHPNGDERFADLRIVETEWGGQPAKVAALTDTTVRRKLERTMADAKSKATATEQRSHSFFSNVNHDLRTPLTHIIGFSEIMKDEQFGPMGQERYRDYASDIHRSGTMLLDMVEDLLSIAESDADTLTLTDEICDLPHLVETVVASQQTAAGVAGIQLENGLATTLPGIRGDAKRLRQALYRLISEVLHASVEGTRIVFTAEEVTGGLALNAEITSADSDHPSLPYDADLSDTRTEDPFLSSEGCGQLRNTGLALSLARRIVELHGGTLAIVRSGTSDLLVTISLPAARLIR